MRGANSIPSPLSHRYSSHLKRVFFFRIRNRRSIFPQSTKLCNIFKQSFRHIYHESANGLQRIKDVYGWVGWKYLASAKAISPLLNDGHRWRKSWWLFRSSSFRALSRKARPRHKKRKEEAAGKRVTGRKRPVSERGESDQLQRHFIIRDELIAASCLCVSLAFQSAIKSSLNKGPATAYK